jgi:L-seryl-tRNA(Ser) seleniumtransferase
VFIRMAEAAAAFPRELVVNEIRRVIERRRNGEDAATLSIEEETLAGLEAILRPTLRHVINATGVILHTNLGRAPLGSIQIESGYSNLEYDLGSGRRGKRDVHIAGLLERLLGMPAIAVNNGAAAVLLVLNELASGKEAIVSRGELIEIGDGFRIPDIMNRSGAVLCEVGTTNRTSLEDYREAIGDRTGVLLRVHRSNFRMSGFTARPSLGELAGLARERGIPLYEDLGSGCLADLKAYGIDEPRVAESLSAGTDLVSFSGDKLLGGPQAGIICGTPELIARVRRNPLYRALRLDKLSVQALSTTLRRIVLERWDEIPAIRMIRQTAEEIRARAERLAAGWPRERVTIEPGSSVIGGGATPEQTLATYVIRIECGDAVRAEQQLRSNDPPVIARIERDGLILDLRTVFEDEESELLRAVSQTVG